MTTVNNLRKILHRKQWEQVGSFGSNVAAGGFMTGDTVGIVGPDCYYYVGSASLIYNYSADEDSWVQLPASGAAGSFAAGSCGEFRSLGAPGGAFKQATTSGTTTTLTTNKTFVRYLDGTVIRVISGTGVGYTGTISSNTIGANSVITVTPASSVAFDATTVFVMYSGSLWFFNAGTTAVGFSVYDRATNSWTAKSVTNLPTAWGTCGQLISTPGAECTLDTGTSSGTNTTTTLNDTLKSWATNTTTNYQVRITGGTGAGQIRTIASNTATALTISVAWTVTPDATSTYVIEGNDDFFYLLGNNAVTLYKYVVSTNTWSTITPGVARSGNMGAGGTADWISSVTTWSGTASSGLKQNGRYIFSFRGGSTTSLDIFDIALSTWTSVTYGNQQESFAAGYCTTYYKDYIYMYSTSGRYMQFNLKKNAMEGFAYQPHSYSTITEGDKIMIVTYKDGNTVIPFLYSQIHNLTVIFRMMIF